MMNFRNPGDGSRLWWEIAVALLLFAIGSGTEKVSGTVVWFLAGAAAWSERRL